jgi:hypothetical protein
MRSTFIRSKVMPMATFGRSEAVPWYSIVPWCDWVCETVQAWLAKARQLDQVREAIR